MKRKRRGRAVLAWTRGCATTWTASAARRPRCDRTPSTWPPSVAYGPQPLPRPTQTVAASLLRQADDHAAKAAELVDLVERLLANP